MIYIAVLLSNILLFKPKAIMGILKFNSKLLIGLYPFISESRQDSALNLTTNGLNSISMSVELNGVVYTGEWQMQQMLC